MQNAATISTAVAFCLAIAGCSSTPSSLIATGSLSKAAEPSGKPAAFAKPVRTGKPTRMYVWAGFKEKDCSPVQPQMSLSATPTKGDVSYRPNEAVTVQHSASGKCVGQRVSGTAIYYTPKAGTDGHDRFTVTAATPNGSTVSRTFNVDIVQSNLAAQIDTRSDSP